MGALYIAITISILLVSIKNLHAEAGLLSPDAEEPTMPKHKKAGNTTTVLTQLVNSGKQNASLLEGTIQDGNLDLPLSSASQKDIPEVDLQTVNVHPRLVRSYSQTMRYDRGRGGYGWGGGYGFGSGGYGYGRPYRPPFGGYGFYGPYRPRPALVIVG